MKKLPWFIIACLLMTVVMSCSAPYIVTITPAAEATQPSQPATNLPASITNLQATQPPATQTPAPSSLPPTETTLPGKPVLITNINMVDAAFGWGWSPITADTFDLLRTSDGGATWYSTTPPGKSINPYGGFFLDAQTAWIPFFDPTTSTSSLLHTADGGKSWSSLPPVESAQNAEYEFSNANDGIAQTAGVGAGQLYLNVYKTNNGGKTWAPVLITPPGPETGLPAGTLHLCNICGDSFYYDNTRAVIAHGDMANDSSGVVRLSISTDLGQHWKDINLPMPDPKYKDGLAGPKIMRFFGPQGVLPVNIIKYNTDGALGSSVLVIYTTQDGGQNWAAAPGVLENSTYQYDTVQIISTMDAFVRCGRNLCATHDGAQTWQTLPDSLNFDSLNGGADYVYQYKFVSPTSGWAISGEGEAVTLWKTTDGGLSWTKLTPSLVK
jgi:photosystem II stability/assembly factor-like uncharacterized protein